ncbi:HdeD family acid-resistance protein [Fusibacter bizertensis]
MTQENRFNSVQIMGLILAVLGLICVAFPAFIGLFAVKVITLMVLVIGFLAMTFAIFVKSRLSMLVSLIIIAVGFYAFANPQYVLFLIGLACMFTGLNGVVLTFSKFKSRNEGTIISSILLMLLGVFAMINTKAALSTVVMILGIMVVIVGVIIFFVGTRLPKTKNKAFFYTFSSNTFAHGKDQEPPKNNNRVIINIDDDEVEEIEYKDL